MKHHETKTCPRLPMFAFAMPQMAPLLHHGLLRFQLRGLQLPSQLPGPLGSGAQCGRSERVTQGRGTPSTAVLREVKLHLVGGLPICRFRLRRTLNEIRVVGFPKQTSDPTYQLYRSIDCNILGTYWKSRPT